MQGWIKGLVVSFVTIVAIILVDILLLYIGLGFNLKFFAAIGLYLNKILQIISAYTGGLFFGAKPSVPAQLVTIVIAMFIGALGGHFIRKKNEKMKNR